MTDDARDLILKLSAALAPFADLARILDVEDQPDGSGVWGGAEQNQRISCWIGPTDLAKARQAYAATVASGHVNVCACTLTQQDETCPVGYPSNLCDVCDGRGVL